MIIIGEKINGSIPSVARAIRERDETLIRNLAIRQTEAGADYLDIAAGADPDTEYETLSWLIGVVQDAVETPLCIDSPDPHTLLDIMPLVKKPGILNSISEEHGKCEVVFPKAADSGWKIIALTCDADGISRDAAVRFNIAAAIIEKAHKYGIARDRLFIDPLITALCANENSLLEFADSIIMIKKQYPDIHITGGLSNVSFGMPCRKAINMQFLAMAMAAGMDCAILDPVSSDMRAALYAAQALLGRDKNCRSYLSAFRRGLFTRRI